MPIDAEELAKLIERQTGPLQLWIRTRSDACEDIVQEAFCRLAVHEPRPENPVAWLYQVCRNLAEKRRLSDERRRKREQARAATALGMRDPVDPLEVAEMLSAVERLDDELRDVLVARIWGQLSLDEVGRLCGVSKATAFRRYEAALKALRLQLESHCENRP
jgi:RNA polymerase sigma-70 factor (ECF subfamily)